MDVSKSVEEELRARAEGKCELCGATEGLAAYVVPPSQEATAERALLTCGLCVPQLEVGAELDEKHWYCLKEAAWSGVPAVQVVSLRLLRRLEDAAWAVELLEQLYIEDDVRAWADEVGHLSDGDGEADAPTLDSNGTPLEDGDAVTLIKNLDVKGGGFTAKRGTMVKNIKLTGDPEHVEGKVNGVMIVLKTKFLKRSS
jgi:protein PhnA